ncbi:DUF262 domain-containing protein [Bradyrhizobium uaiense]|uniref:DUF262 domain-containing protein n=1 Tax=Bradyrhizobium uaiense TaxID=2594946 RepID=A0A6P1BC66_9BRAD|nr:DUF262 domain-containing protein [Bradyrhizobium uaiense]NEU96027.1 DUF262 domain-containing protein [Bradyrhizobium uaiense]
MSKTLAAHEQPISRIFCNEYVFQIPPYQRPYSWTTEEAGELIGDLLGFMRARPLAVEEMPPYFLGSIVLIKDEGSPNGDVVDGQQRLTTLTILLAAIRANVSKANASDITQLIYEKGSQILGTQDRFRLTLRERDREFFQKYLQREDGFSQLLELSDGSNDSQRNIRSNARLFDEKLKALPESERLQLAQFIVTRCYLVVVATPDLNSAYRIFSVLNTRGLDLSATDILKAEVVGAFANNQRDAYTKKWEDTEEDLGRESFNELFSHIRMIYRKAKPQGTLLVEFRDHVLSKMNPQQFIDDLLLPAAEMYEQLTGATYASPVHAEHVNENLKWLTRLEFTDWLPPALAFAIRRRNQPELMDTFFRDLERLAYCLLITKAGVNERIERFSRVTQEVESDANLFLPSSALQVTPAEQFETYGVLNGPIYESLSARARTVVLLRLDALVSGGGASYQYETVSVEHVLPQNPAEGSDWLVWFPTPQTRLTVHTLGNLALLTRKKNSAASNYEFSKKKDAYFTRNGVSPFPLTTQVLQHSSWTPTIVAARQEELLSIFEQHWRLQDRKGPNTEAEVIVATMFDTTWRGDVCTALRNLGGRASLQNIYEQVRLVRATAGRSLPQSLEAIVRRTLEESCRETDSFKDQEDLFVMPSGKGAGIWALRGS